MKTILILGAGLKQRPAMHAARRLGLRIIAMDPNPRAIGFGEADEAVVCDLADLDRCVDVARREHVDGVLTLAADYPVPAVGHVCEQLGLPGISSDVARQATNKRAMRQALMAAGVPCPISHHVTQFADVMTIVGELDAPVIIKPALSNGSQGITRLSRNADKLDLQDAFERAMTFTRADGVMVEEFVEGPEFSVEALTLEGVTHVVAVTDKLTCEPHCVEIGHSQPSLWPEAELKQIREVAVAAVAALGIDWSASHTEIRLTADGPRVIEVGARLGGGYITSHLVPLSTGVDLVAAAIQVALGERPLLSTTHSRGAAIQFLTPQPGVVRQIDGIDRCRRFAGVHEVVVEVAVGEEIGPLVDNSARAGHVICSAETASDAQRLVQQACNAIVIRTSPERPLSPPTGIATHAIL